MGKEIIGLSIILTLAIIVRVAAIDNPFSHDEWYTYDIVARDFMDMNIQMFDDVHVPLYFYLLKIWTFFTGTSFFAMKLFSVVLGVLGILIFWNFSNKYFSKMTAKIATSIVTISAFHVAYSATARMYSLLFLFAIIAIYYLFEIIFSNNRQAIIGLTVANIGLIYTHLFGVFFIGFEIVALLVYHKKIRKTKRIILGYLALAIAAIPFALYVVVQIKRKIDGTSYGNWMPETPLLDIYYAFSAISSNNILTFFFLGLLIYFIIMQIKNRSKRSADNDKKNILILGVLICYVFPSIITLITPIFAWRYFFIVYPLFILIFSLSIEHLCSSRKKCLIITLLITFILLALSTTAVLKTFREASISEETCYTNTIKLINEYKEKNTTFVSYRWLNEWVPNHKPITKAFHKYEQKLNLELLKINYHNTNITYLFDDSEYIFIISPSDWISKYTLIDSARVVDKKNCYGYNTYIFEQIK